MGFVVCLVKILEHRVFSFSSFRIGDCSEKHHMGLNPIQNMGVFTEKFPLYCGWVSRPEAPGEEIHSLVSLILSHSRWPDTIFFSTGEKERERGSVCVCVCVCVRARACNKVHNLQARLLVLLEVQSAEVTYPVLN